MQLIYLLYITCLFWILKNNSEYLTYMIRINLFGLLGAVSHGDVPAVRESEDVLPGAMAHLPTAVPGQAEGRAQDGQGGARVTLQARVVSSSPTNTSRCYNVVATL